MGIIPGRERRVNRVENSPQRWATIEHEQATNGSKPPSCKRRAEIDWLKLAARLIQSPQPTSSAALGKARSPKDSCLTGFLANSSWYILRLPLIPIGSDSMLNPRSR